MKNPMTGCPPWCEIIEHPGVISASTRHSGGVDDISTPSGALDVEINGRADSPEILVVLWSVDGTGYLPLSAEQAALVAEAIELSGGAGWLSQSLTAATRTLGYRRSHL